MNTKEQEADIQMRMCMAEYPLGVILIEKESKLEQKKEELEFLKKIKKLLMYNSYDLKNDGTLWIKYSDLNKLVKRYEK